MADPEGGEFCAFVRDKIPAYKPIELVVDSTDPERQARWWAAVLGGEVGHGEQPWWWLENVPGLPFSYWVFNPVPEPKTVKNRIHWDISADAAEPVLEAGATLLRAPDDEIDWYVCADPEGQRVLRVPAVTRRRRRGRMTANMTAKLDLSLSGPDLTAALVDIESVSGNEEPDRGRGRGGAVVVPASRPSAGTATRWSRGLTSAGPSGSWSPGTSTPCR